MSYSSDVSNKKIQNIINFWKLFISA